MVDARNVDRVLRTVRRATAAWRAPVVGDYRADPFRVLVSCVLSLRTRDAVTEAASRRLFRRARTPRGLLRLEEEEIAALIRPVAFYRTKAGSLRRMAKTILDRHAGAVPSDLDALLELDGVGRKTANLVVTLGFGGMGICVDTHVHRITNRWGYVRTRSADETEAALRRRLPRPWWIEINDLLVAFGQNCCHPTSPWCSRCPVATPCARRGVVRSR